MDPSIVHQVRDRLDEIRAERDAAQTERDRLRSVNTKLLAALLAFMTEASQSGGPYGLTGPVSIDTATQARDVVAEARGQEAGS